VDFTQSPYKLYGKSGKTYLAHKVLIATGTRARLLNVPGASENINQILYNWNIQNDLDQFKRNCRDKTVAIIGGGVDAAKKPISL